MTLGDYFRMRYNRTVEVLTTLCIVASYLGWVSAQIKALGLVFNVCLLYTSDAADERSSVDLGVRRIIKKKKLRTHV